MQSIPNGGFSPSPSGDLHASSVGSTYPWSIQPRVRLDPHDSRFGLLVRCPPPQVITMWVAFNALTGETGPQLPTYELARNHALSRIADGNGNPGERAAQSQREAPDSFEQNPRTMTARELTVHRAAQGRLLPDVRR